MPNRASSQLFVFNLVPQAPEFHASQMENETEDKEIKINKRRDALLYFMRSNLTENETRKLFSSAASQKYL